MSHWLDEFDLSFLASQENKKERDEPLLRRHHGQHAPPFLFHSSLFYWFFCFGRHISLALDFASCSVWHVSLMRSRTRIGNKRLFRMDGWIVVHHKTNEAGHTHTENKLGSPAKLRTSTHTHTHARTHNKESWPLLQDYWHMSIIKSGRRKDQDVGHSSNISLCATSNRKTNFEWRKTGSRRRRRPQAKAKVTVIENRSGMRGWEWMDGVVAMMMNVKWMESESNRPAGRAGFFPFFFLPSPLRWIRGYCNSNIDWMMLVMPLHFDAAVGMTRVDWAECCHRILPLPDWELAQSWWPTPLSSYDFHHPWTKIDQNYYDQALIDD